MSIAERAATVVTGGLASAIVVAYGMDAVGLALSPAVTLVLSVLTGVALMRAEPDDSARQASAAPTLSWIAVVVLVLVWLVWLAWPALLLPGGGPDLAHHLLLIDYIERSRHLVHVPALAGAMGEMAAYTPGSHLLAVLAGAWTRTDGFRAVYPLVAVTTALKAGFVFLIARRALPVDAPHTPLALVGVLLVALPRAYVADAFAHDSYLAQVVSELFAVAMWWAITMWDERPSARRARAVALMGAAVFLTWPIWIGPPALVCLVVMATHRDLPWTTRTRHIAVAIAPIAAVALIHSLGRLGWVAVVGTSGAVIAPSIATFGVGLPLLALAGVAVSTRDRRARPTVLMLAAIGLQCIALYTVARIRGSETPYMALKMVYLAIYPMAVLGAMAIARGVEGFRQVQEATAWAGVMALAVVIGRPVIAVPRPVPAVSRDLYDAGRWTRDHVGAGCVDYLVPNADAIYWLHLAVLGNPRTSARTAQIDREPMRDVMARWIEGSGEPYAIADLTVLPDEVRNRVELIQRFGVAGVIKRPGAQTCLNLSEPF